jgi:parallel beta-helix repeat protein
MFFITTLSLILIHVSPVVQTVPSIYQEIIIVDPAGGGDYTNIKDAVKNANPLSIIQVRPGTYKESNIHIKNKIALVGTSSENTIIDLDDGRGFSIESTHVEIHDLKIINSKGSAFYAPPESNNFNISNCIIEGSRYHGIVIESSHSKVSNCEIRSEGEASHQGIKVGGNNNIVERCTTQGFGVGILILIWANNNQILNCNTFNNDEAGIDIRIDSKNNIISSCNIYGNYYGVHIWENSKDNSVYLNNLWKNEINAKDEYQNYWDNGINGNYWEDYTGTDLDKDGIGDTPYVISEGNEDRYPLMTKILPDEISPPLGLELTSPTWVDKPTFSWDPSAYSKTVAGYYVKIDTDSLTYIGDTTTWTSPSSLLDGLHIFYVKALGDDGSTSDYASLTFMIDSTFVDNDKDGWSDEEEIQYGTNPNNPNSLPLDTDEDHIPNEDDLDDDGDEISDAIENTLGSDPLEESDVIKIYLAGSPYNLIDTTRDGEYDILYKSTSQKTTSVVKQNNKYLIDKNADGSWDYVYNAATGAVTAYKESTIESNFLWMIIAIILMIIILFILLYFLKIKPKRDKTLIQSKKLYGKPLTLDSFGKDPIAKIDKTRQLLENIQQDVKLQMEQLNQMEAKIKVPPVKPEEIKTPSLEEIEEPKIVKDEELDISSFERKERIDEREITRDKKVETLPVRRDEDSGPEFVGDERVETVPVERLEEEVEEVVEPEFLEGEEVVEPEFVGDERVETVPVERLEEEVEEVVEPEFLEGEELEIPPSEEIEESEDEKDRSELRNEIDEFLSNKRKKQRKDEEQ